MPVVTLSRFAILFGPLLVGYHAIRAFLYVQAHKPYQYVDAVTTLKQCLIKIWL